MDVNWGTGCNKSRLAGSFISSGTGGRRVGKHNLRRNNSGFTLVELIVVIVLIAVMAALTVGGILAWRDWADFNRENEYAETLFVAAQNQLNDYSADGRLEAMQKALKPDFSKAGGSTEDDNADVMSRLRSVSGNKVEFGVGKNWKVYDGDTLNEHFVESGYTRDEINNIWKNSGAEEKYQDRIISLRANKGDYSGYLSGTYSKNTEQYWVYELLSSYIYDQSILNDAAICIELTPADGQVFSVFYSDKNKSYTYAKSEVEDNNSDVYDITHSSDEAEDKRSEEKRRSRKVGYYDVEALYKATTTASRKSPVIDHVEVHNEETLYLTYEITKEPQAVNQLTYKVSLLDADKGNKPELVIEIDGTKIKGRNIGLDGDLLPLSGSLEKYTVPCKVTRYDLACETGSTEVRRASESSSASVSSGVVMDSVPVIVWSEGTDSAGNYITTGSTTVPRIHVLLDMADLNATQDEYAAYSKGIRDFYKDKRFGSSGDNSLSQDANIEDNSFTGTQSFFRFGLAPDDVFAKVEGSSTSKYKSPAPANNIDAWGRNLENTGFAEGSEVAEGEEGKKRITYSVTKSRHLYNMRYIEALDYESQDIVLITTGPAAQLGYAPVAGVDYTIVRDSDNNGDIAWDKSIEKQLADKADQPLRAVSDNSIYPACERLRVNDTLFGGGNTISGLKVINEKVVEENKYTAFNPTGFINRNYGTVRDLTLDRTEVSGGDFTGGFFGVNACGATNLTMTDTCKVEGRKYVGGIAGIVLPSGNHVDTVKNVYNMKTDEKQDIEKAEKMEKLVNRAEVVGAQAVGGITGAVRNDFEAIKKLYTKAEDEGTLAEEDPGNIDTGKARISETDDILKDLDGSITFLISECENYGAVKTAVKGSGDTLINKSDIGYIGGIAGYIYDRYSDSADSLIKDTVHILIDGCNGAPMYEKADVDDIFKNATVFISDRAQGSFVGGIVGYNYGGQISGCYSKADTGADTDSDRKSYVIGRDYVGGIAGFNKGYLGGDVEGNRIKNGKITAGYGSDKDRIPGINRSIVAGIDYVGGITGSNADYVYSYTDNTVEDTSSKKKFKDIDSYDPEDIITEKKKDNSISIVPKKDVNLNNRLIGFINEAQVYTGGMYGGGVSGYNTGYMYGNNNVFYQLDTSSVFGNNEENYKGSYIGGIAGYNNGVMGNTKRTVSVDGKISTVSDTNTNSRTIENNCYIRGRNYLGGVIGYNDSDSVIEDYEAKNGAVYGGSGSCFVGGYAGFNSAPGLLMDSTAENTEDETGSISYNGSHIIYSNVDVVEGDYFVGGDIGGNILNKQENPKINNIAVEFRSDGFFRRLKGREFVGGYIGYNLIINNISEEIKDVDKDYANKNPSRIIADYLAATVGSAEKDIQSNKAVVDRLSDNVAGLKFVDTTDPTSYMRLYIKGQKGRAISSMSRIEGEICVGGVLGYNDDNTILYIEDVENSIPIYATASIEYPEERTVNRLIGDLRVIENDGTKDYTGNQRDPGDPFVYSYGGGIIGKVGGRTTLKNCRNAQQGLINTKGTYLGGLCEVCEAGGKIINCSISNLGYSTHDYVGGLCGLNKGLIEQCVIDNKTISGRNVVGGLTAENLGILRNNSINDTHIRAGKQEVTNKSGEQEYHGVAGTYTGVNGVSGEIILSVNAKPGSQYDIENIDVVSEGRYVGGIAGVNKGFIYNDKEAFKQRYIDNYTGYTDDDMKTWLTFKGTVRGESYVGGLVGKNDIDTEGKEETIALKYMLKGFDSYADVIADNGTAGGMIGQTTGKSNISSCANHGVVSSPLKGNSGGIIAENSGVINHCRDFASVSAVNGMSGGIAAINRPDGEIIDIRVEAPSGVNQKIIFESKTDCGAVAAQNFGKISGIYLYNVSVTNEKGYERANIGAVVGQNIFPTGSDGRTYDYNNETDRKKYGYIDLGGVNQWDYDDSTAIDSFKNIIKAEVTVRSNYSNAGGVAGTNSGTITGESVERRGLVAPSIRMSGCDRANIGGVAGTNSRIIENVSVDADITGGKGNNNIGYGGVTGVNTGTIRYSTFDGVLNSFGDASNPASTGGITGINRSGAIVEYCSLGAIRHPDGYDKTYNERTGSRGLITWISTGDFYGRDYHNPDLTAYAYLGGIAGDNYGIVRDIDLSNKRRTYETNNLESYDYVGVIGFNGTTGGLVGINRQGGNVTGYKDSNGDIHYITTHSDLEAAMHGSETGSGAGGIIGIDYSGGPFRYMENNTFVQARYDVDVRAGGIIGNCKPENSKRVEMDNITNRGRVNGYYASGGLIGELMYGGYTISDCTNYGEISSEHGDAGGMIGSTEMANTNCYFNRCINHGHVYVTQYAWDDDLYYLVEEAMQEAGVDQEEGYDPVDPWDGMTCPDSRTYVRGDYTYEFRLSQSWSGGYRAEVFMTNNSLNKVDFWAIKMNYQGNLPGNIVGATSQSGEKPNYILRNLFWDTDIGYGETGKLFEFNGNEDFPGFPAYINTMGGETVRPKSDYSIGYGSSSDGAEFWKEITITNNSDRNIENWNIRFSFDGEITHTGDAELISHEGNSYIIKNGGNSNNGFIQPGQTVKFSIYGIGSSALNPYNISLYSYEDTVDPSGSSSEVTPAGGKHKHNGAGGLLGSYREPRDYTVDPDKAENIYLYDCVNTGIVERIWAKGATPDDDHRAQYIGSFVGMGYSELDEDTTGKIYRSYWHFDTCRNYNSPEGLTEGFIGTSIYMAGENFTNCFDYSALITKNEKYSPFLTNQSKVTMSNCYYLNNKDSEAEEEQEIVKKDNGTYFTFIREDDTNIYFGDKQYKSLKAPGLFLTPPSENTGMHIPKKSNSTVVKGSFQLGVTNTDDSPGMKALNIYLWNGKDNNTELVYNYKVTATFVKSKYETQTVERTVAATSDLNSSKVVLPVDDWLNPILRISVTIERESVTGGTGDDNIHLRGITWTPRNDVQELACNHLSEKYDVEFNIDSIDTDHSTKAISVRNGPQYTSSEYSSDALGVNLLPDEACYLRRKSTSSVATMTIGVDQGENSKGIKQLILYPACNPSYIYNRTYRYYLRVEIYSPNRKNSQNYPASSTSDSYYYTTEIGSTPERIVINVQSDWRDMYMIRISCKGAEYRENGGSRKDTDYFYFAGMGIVPVGDSKEYRLAPKTSSEGASYAASLSGGSGSGKYRDRAIKLAVDSSEAPARYKVYDPKAKSHYFYMTENDPLSSVYFNDRTSYDNSKENVANGRIKVYEEIEGKEFSSDSKFIDFIKQDYTFDETQSDKDKLDKPAPLNFENDGSDLKFSWDKVGGAYAYNILYRIIDDNGNEIEGPYDITLGTETTSYSIYNKPEWQGKGYSIEFSIKAVDGGDSQYDSDYNILIHKISRMVLPSPKVHLELTDDNNMAAVLDNREDYAIKDSDGNILDYIDCDVSVTFNARGTDLKRERREIYTIHVKDSRFSTQSSWVELDDEDSKKAQIIAWAKPSDSTLDKYVDSSEVVSSGHLADNEELGYGDSSYTDEEYVKYRGMTYIPYGYKKRLRGFKGTDVEHMEYVIQYKHFEDRDAWMRSDISVYDEDLEMWVAEVSNEAHIGATGGHADYITTLGNLPKEWFSDTNPTRLLVRNYLARSENDLVLYGHDVASGIKLNGGSAEANKEILKQIKDPYYLTIDWRNTSEEMEKNEVYSLKVIENESVWDDEANTLKDGYVLVKDSVDPEEDGEQTYSIYYNSTLNIAKNKVSEANKKGYTDRYGNEYEYYTYDVVYKYYDTSVKDITVEYDDSTEPETVSANDIRAMGDHRQITLENGHVVGTNYNEAYQFSRTNDKYSSRIYQDTSPAPILSGGIKQGKDADGKTTYTISWDEFYRNEKVWNRDYKNPLDPESAAEMETYEYYHPYYCDPVELAPDGTKEDYYVANTWTAFANKAGYYEEPDKGKRKAMMNAYYLTYAHNNSYTVDILGIVEKDDGTEDQVVLATQVITDKDKVPVNDRYTEITYEPEDSDGNKFEVDGSYIEAPLYKKWVYKATFTRENDWVYDNYRIRITNNGSLYCMLEGLTTPDGVLMGVNDTREGNIGRLYYDEPFDDIEETETDNNLCYYRTPRYREFKLEPREPFKSVGDIKSVVLKADQGGKTYAGGLDHTITWTGLTSEEEKKELGGYLITVKPVESGLEEISNKTHYFYVEEIPDEEALNASIDIDITSLEENGIVKKVDVVSGNYIKNEGDDRSLDIDLSDFDDGESVDILVNAIPRTGAKTYSDSEDGVPFEWVISEAMHAPDPDKISVDSTGRIPEYDDPATFRVTADSLSQNSITEGLVDDGETTYSAVEYDTWVNGLWISYKRSLDSTKPDNYMNDEDVIVNAAIAVYADAPDESELPSEEDAAGSETGNDPRKRAFDDYGLAWDDAAEVTLYSKEEPLSLGYVEDGDYVQVVFKDLLDNTGTKYAGMWLKIALKAVSPNSVDSRWSDQDASGVSVNYRWIHLPYVEKNGDEEGTEGNEASTYDSFKVTSGVGDLLIEENGSDILDNGQGGNTGEKLTEAEQLIPDSKPSTTAPKITPTPTPVPTIVPTPTPTPVPTPTPATTPEDADVPSGGSENGSDEDKDKGSSGNGGSGGQESGSDPGTTDNNAGA